MPATIRVEGVEATVKDGEWSSEDEFMLSRVEPFKHGKYGPSGSVPDPDLHLANQAAKALGGKVVNHQPLQRDPNLIY